jgi:hypothetical protein
MVSSQLGRVLLATPSSSPDAQEARAGEGGSYDDLMETIDRVLEEAGGPQA